MAAVNVTYPIILELDGGETNQYPKAVIMNDAGAVQDWFLMSHVTDGCYLSTGWTPSVEDYYHITKEVFTDSLFTTSSSTYGITVELVKVDSIENDVTSITSNVSWHNTQMVSMGTWIYQSVTTQIDANETKINTLTTDVAALNDVSIAQIHSTATWLNNEINIPDLSDDIATLMSSVSFLWNVEGGKWTRSGNIMHFYEDDNATSVCSFTLYDANGNVANNSSIVFRRDRR